MATKAGSIYAEIRARLDKYEKDLAKAHGITTKGADKIQKRINKISFAKASQSMAQFTRLFNTAAIALAGGGAIGSLLKISTDYEDSIFQMSQTFQGQTDAMIQKAKDMASQFKYFYDFNDISYAFTKTADSMQRYGITGEKYIQLVTRAADIGAAKNLQLKESIDRIESAMRGEAEASEYLGLTLNDTYMKNIAFDGALKNTWETMTDMEKTQARFNELMNQSAKYNGVAEQAANTLSGAMTSLGKAMKDRLQPYLESTNKAISSIIIKLRDLWTAEKVFTKQAGLKQQQEDLLKRQKSIQTAIQEIAKSNTPNKQTIIDRMFEKLGLVEAKLQIVSGELYALDKAAAKMTSEKRTVDIKTNFVGAPAGVNKDAIKKPDYPGAYAFELNRFRQSEILKRDIVQETYDAMDAFEMNRFRQSEVLQRDSIKNVASSYDELLQLSERTAWAMQENFSNGVYAAMKGELKSFKDYFSSIIDSMQRAWADIMGQMASEWIFGSGMKGGGALSTAWDFLSGYLGGGGSAGGATALSSARWSPRATGGPVSTAKKYLVGESGPELFIPNSDGRIDNLRGSSASNKSTKNIYNVYHITANDAASFLDMARRSGAIPLLAAENLSENGLLRSAILENV